MFESLHSLPKGRVIVAVHQLLGIVRHYKSYPPEEREWYARAKAKAAGDNETDLALALLDEIERAEGTPLSEMDLDVVERYLDPLRDYAMKRSREGLPPGDPERARRTLEAMRRAWERGESLRA